MFDVKQTFFFDFCQIDEHIVTDPSIKNQSKFKDLKNSAHKIGKKALKTSRIVAGKKRRAPKRPPRA